MTGLRHLATGTGLCPVRVRTQQRLQMLATPRIQAILPFPRRVGTTGTKCSQLAPLFPIPLRK
jgi:hypothetical protein